MLTDTVRVSGVLSKKDIVGEDMEVAGGGWLIRDCDTDQFCSSDVRERHQQAHIMSRHAELCDGQAKQRTQWESPPSAMHTSIL